MKIETRNEYGDVDTFESDEILRVGNDYVKWAVTINCSGVMNRAPSEAEAQRLAEVAHAGKNWTWGVLLVKQQRPKEQSDAQSNSSDGVPPPPAVSSDLNR